VLIIKKVHSKLNKLFVTLPSKTNKLKKNEYKEMDDDGLSCPDDDGYASN
jgi:hypothetical protein